MLQEARGPGRRFRTAPLKYPFGRGITRQLVGAAGVVATGQYGRRSPGILGARR